jgi:serine phosphatase RsbU (regulator of sigma subunit)
VTGRLGGSIAVESRPDAPSTAGADDRLLHLALQGSERYRLLVLLVTIAAALGLAWLRHEMGGKVMGNSAFLPTVLLFVAAAAYVVVSLAVIQYANRRGILLPSAFWIAGVALESLIPTVAIGIIRALAGVPVKETFGPPVMLMYGIIIALSVLRLRPWLSLLSGALCAAGHGALTVRLILSQPLPPHELPYVLSYPVYLLVMGVATALVGREVTKYFRASLQEAETRRKLDLVQNELQIARVIQQELMPKNPPQVPGFDIAGWNRPADQTGGDYYDWQVLPDGRVVTVIADVSGHGVGPALLMAVCRAYARACVPMGPELRSALGRVNELLSGDVSAGRFVTLAVTLVEPQSGQFELLSAGHGPILHFHAKEASVEVFDCDGTPLGILENEDYGTPRPRRIEPGDLLLFVTDGFTEWARAGDGEQYGLDRLREFVLKNAGLDARTLIDQLDADVRAFGLGTRQSDDMTAVVVRRLHS